MIRAVRIIAGFAAPHLLAAALIALTRPLLNGWPAVLLICSYFTAVPALMGFVSAACWRGLGWSTWAHVAGALGNVVLALLLAAAFMREGVICLIIVSPLLITFLLGGTMLGAMAFEKGGRLQAAVAPVLLLYLLLDARTPHPHYQTVTDSLLIHAPPSQVWKYVVEVPPIREEPRFWLFRLGLPPPVRTTATGHRVGAERRCIFAGDLVFQERITALEPGRRLAFDILRQPDHPELLGHADVLQGEMTLRDNGNGTTTLVGTTAYRLHVQPAAYYDLWAMQIGREVHGSVMRQIKRLAEGAR